MKETLYAYFDYGCHNIPYPISKYDLYRWLKSRTNKVLYIS